MGNAELGHMYTEVGEYDVAHDYFMVAFESAANMGTLALQRKAAFNVAVSLISLKQYASAINILKPLLDVAEIDDVAKSSNAMIAYAQFKMHNYRAAKATAEMGYNKKLIVAKSPRSDWERMYSAIIAISEHMSGNHLEAVEWDKKADITSLSTTTNDILLGVLMKRLEQHGNPLHILSGYVAMHENAFSMFKERQSSTLAKHLISYNHKQADMHKDKTLTKDAMNKEIINQEAKHFGAQAKLCESVNVTLFDGQSSEGLSFQLLGKKKEQSWADATAIDTFTSTTFTLLDSELNDDEYGLRICNSEECLEKTYLINTDGISEKPIACQ